MSKIPFDIKYRPQIESREYKVGTRSGKNVRIICWDKIGVPIVALVGDADDIVTYNRDGTTGQQMQLPSDLFIVMPEEELTEFEQEVSDIVEYCKEHGEHVAFDYAKRHAKTLLALAKKELLSEKMLIEQTYNPDISKAHELGREEGIMFGKAEALKNLPRWKTIKKDDNAIARIPHVGTNILGEKMLYIGENAISISCLMRLPGFNED